ncbi:HET-domain-containing protein, partial [Lentithecium fluviatile CBS 122367]
MSPYDEINPNEEWYKSTEPNLPPHDPDGSKVDYHPLSNHPSARWIRVLRLEPGWAYLKIRCSLIHINIDDDHVPYEAISYTWGKDQRFEQIICNGSWTSVTRSLAQALQMFRLIDRARILWADALCINQEDEEEKSWQVGLMRHIYTHAFHVLVWIG